MSERICGAPWGLCPVRSREQGRAAPHRCRVLTDGSEHKHNCSACKQVQA